MASSSVDTMNVLKFAKLNGANYRTWAFNMRLYLESLDLFEHADGSAEAPISTDGDDDATLLRAFNSRAKKAWTYICLAVEPEQQIHVRDTKTAKEAWDALKNQFARESILQKVRLRQQYYSCRFQSGGNMLEHISHLRSLHDQLKEMGVSIDDTELAMTLLASLPEEFKALITALDAVGEDNLSFEKVKDMLLNDADRSLDTFYAKKSEDAFSARRSMGHKRGKQGHGPSGPVNNEVKYDKPFRGTCHNCKEKGHFARDCPKKLPKDNSQRGNMRSKASANCAEDNDPVQFIYEEALITSDQVNNCEWIIDSGATQHMTFEKDSLSDYVEFKQPCIVNLGNNATIFAYGKGTYRLVADLEDSAQHIALHDVLYLPDLNKNLLSFRAMTKLGASVDFEGNVCRISRNSKLLAVGEMQGKLYILKTVPDEHLNIAKDNTDMQLWHCRFGHLGMDNVSKLVKSKMVKGMDCNVKAERKSVCEPCVMGKQHRTPYPKGVSTRATEVFEVVHSDVCGPMSVNSLGGSQYFVTFIDDYSRYTHVYFIKHKHEVLDKFKEFVNFTTNVTGRQMKTLVTENHVKTLRSDNGGEYGSKMFDAYLKEKGIVHETTVPFNPAQNGVSERMNHTIVETALSMLSQSNMPNEFWAEAINTAVYLRNRSPTTSLNAITPYEALFNRKPDVSHLRVFGCRAFVHIPKEQRKKFEEKSRKSVFVGYPDGTKGYKLYDLKSRRFIRSRDVIFVEKEFHDFDNGQSLKLDLQFFYPICDVPNVPDQIVEKDQIIEEVQENIDQAELEIEEPAVIDNQPVGDTYEDKFMREVENLRPQRQPLEQGRKFQLLSDDEKPIDVQAYQMIIGCLTYATTATRPDLAAAVGILSKFMSKPGKDHWTGIKRILRYIQGTLNYGLVFSADDKSHTLVGFSDADWAGDLDTRRSTSGYVFQIQGNSVSWCSKRQATVSKSSTEAEYTALSGACQEAVWMRRLLADIGFEQRGPSTIFEDNKGAIELAKNPKFHNRTKHIDVSFHFIREQVNLKAISVKYCPTQDMLAEIMNKGLPKIAFQKFRDNLGVKEIN